MHKCSICHFPGRRDLVVIDFQWKDDETRKFSIAAAKALNMSLEKYLRHALHDYLEKHYPNG